MLAKRFPYAIYYEIVDDIVYVGTCDDIRKDAKQLLPQSRCTRWTEAGQGPGRRKGAFDLEGLLGPAVNEPRQVFW